MPPTKVPGPSGRSPGKDTTTGSRPCHSLGQLQGPRGDRHFSDDNQCLGGHGQLSRQVREAPSPERLAYPLLRQASFAGNQMILTQSKRPCNRLRARSRRSRALRPASARRSRAVGAGPASTGVLGATLS